MIVGASLDETVPVPCHVAADPLDVSFDWNFSNSGERFEVASGQFNLLQEFHPEGITQSRYDADEDNSGKTRASRFPGCPYRAFVLSVLSFLFLWYYFTLTLGSGDTVQRRHRFDH